MSSDYISLTQPDDWHLHLRDEEALTTTVPHSARAFARAIVMPNLEPPVTTVAAALAYRDRILAAVPAGNNFQPLMTLYLTDSLKVEEIERAKSAEPIIAVKYYPAGVTTNSENGVSQIENVYPVLQRMEELELPLLIHGEVTDTDVDIFDREQQFIETVLRPLLQRFPQLKLVLEHITTSHAVDFVLQQANRVAATITVHHLLYNRNHLLAGGVRPHFFCLPVLKRSSHQQALIKAATGGNPKFFLGTDSAPHSRHNKENDCGCAGIYSAPSAIELYAEVFEAQGALEKLEGFASFYGADFYGLPRNQSQLKLSKSTWQPPKDFPFAEGVVVPIRANETVNWRIVEDAE
ncbi:MAG: dihydroorotase [Proteobacteria bacterium]|nr:dihydroorotase [Pseudomonadota bacterium]